MPPHALENGWEPGGEATDDLGCYYRTVLSHQDDRAFQALFTRLGFDRATASAIWAQVRDRPWGHTRVMPHKRAPLYEFVTNDSHAHREPLGTLTVRWRRMPMSDRLIDLEVVNDPPDDEAGGETAGPILRA